MRWLVRLFACAFALVAAVLLACGVRSFWRNDSLFVARGDKGCFVASARGRLGVIEVPNQWRSNQFHWASYDLSTDSSVLVSITKSKDTKDLYFMLSGDGKLPRFGQGRWFAIPHAVPVAIFATPPIVVTWTAWRRRRRRRRGMCSNCGYDLRASTGRCPECGAMSEDNAAPATADAAVA